MGHHSLSPVVSEDTEGQSGPHSTSLEVAGVVSSSPVPLSGLPMSVAGQVNIYLNSLSPAPISGLKIQLAVWLISGDHAKRDTFLWKLLTSSWHHDDQSP